MNRVVLLWVENRVEFLPHDIPPGAVLTALIVLGILVGLVSFALAGTGGGER